MATRALPQLGETRRAWKYSALGAGLSQASARAILAMAVAVRYCAFAPTAGIRPPRTKENWPGCLTTEQIDVGKRPDVVRLMMTSATASWPDSGSPFDSK